MSKTSYILSTIVYGMIFVIALSLSVYFSIIHRWFLVIISLLMIYVCLDNFFCGARACKVGYRIKTHYAIPPFFKKK